MPIATPVFDGAKEAEIKELERSWATCRTSGRITLFDGRTGEQFERPVTVGWRHAETGTTWVDDKCTLVPPVLTAWPLSSRCGKAQFRWSALR
ncbi:hypothetical protein MJ575_01955 [Klebsiella pneumoniae]|nr:hypothetical protein MJ575_01955 [Klebsiella pneumoniae]